MESQKILVHFLAYNIAKGAQDQSLSCLLWQQTVEEVENVITPYILSNKLFIYNLWVS